MVAKKLFLGLFVFFLSTTALATTRSPRLVGPAFCDFQRLTATQPSQHFEFEGGFVETWDVNDDQFQCVGVSMSRYTLHPNSLSLPSFHPFPSLVFIEEGEGIIGVNFPGCAETYVAGVQTQQRESPLSEGKHEKQKSGCETSDSHQKVHRFKRGDIVAIPASAVHWTYNNGNQKVVAIIINDINNPGNQLDMQPRSFFLAGGITSQHRQGQRQQQEGEFNMDNIFAGFDTELLAEAFNSDPKVVRAMQESSDRGVIVRVHEPMKFVTPEEQQGKPRGSSNGIEETFCSTKIVYNLDSQREADLFSRKAGKVNNVVEQKLPILASMDLSAEKGHLLPNALASPVWSLNSHTIMYVLNGNAQVQTVSNKGEAVTDQKLRKGDIFVVPQSFMSLGRAGEKGFEWVAFKTSKSPMKSAVAGYISVFRALPLEVITNAYQISPRQAQNLKTNRETESILFSPQRTSQIS